jgi:hypothetical protein
MTPGGLLHGTRGLAQVGRVREGADGQGGRHDGLGVQKAPLLLKFDHKFAWEGLTLIERKTASSNRIAVINLNLLRDLLRSRAVRTGRDQTVRK